MRIASSTQTRRAARRSDRVVLLTIIGLSVVVLVVIVLLNWMGQRPAASSPVTVETPGELLPPAAPVNPITGGHDMDHIPNPAGFPSRKVDAALPQPNVDLPVTRFDWGTIPLSPPAEYTFPIQNMGNQPLLITRVVTSCGCTTAALSSSVIPSGQRADLQVTFDPNFHAAAGPVVRLVWLETNDPDMPLVELRLDANVVP
jgi:hypothetical protein